MLLHALPPGAQDIYNCIYITIERYTCMRYCSILALNKAREQGKETPLCCDSESAQRQEKETATSSSWSMMFLIVLVTFFALALINAS